MASFEELKNKMMAAIQGLERTVMEGKTPPTTPQEIPEIFSEYTGTARKGLRTALWIARRYNLIPQQSPLRQVWYAFIKLTLQKINEARSAAGLKRIEGKENTYYGALGDIIGATDLWYSDFNILNDPAGFQYPDTFSYAILFPNVMIALEKESYYGAFKKFCDLLGLTLYAGGGNPSKSASETVAKKVHDIFPNDRLKIYTISDYDPAGFSIANVFKDHMKLYLDRFNQDVDSDRVAPYPEHYTPDELSRSIYTVSKDNLKIWNEGIAKSTRDAAGLGQTEGMEVESLPASLLPSQIPSGMNATDGVGGARMRVILFDKLIEDFDLSDSLKKFMDRYFFISPDSEASTIIDNNSGISKINDRAWDMYYKIENIGKKLRKELESDEEELGNEIRDWRDEEVESWINDSSKVDTFEDALKRAIIRNEGQTDFSYRFRRTFPNLPNNFREWETPLKTKDKIQEQEDYINKLLEELDERIDSIDIEPDYEEEQDYE
ncbi:hypothetical protein LCGC14_0741860 [marine sediment metagenome]|uniref:Uncharacterized protein n=1 Tax=marine sediment metagenome TaxID=412755 RepID=A0A0F9QRI6_9ZZZZ